MSLHKYLRQFQCLCGLVFARLTGFSNICPSTLLFKSWSVFLVFVSLVNVNLLNW